MNSNELKAIAEGTIDPEGNIRGAWLSNYYDLRAAGIRWQQAAFAAWHNAPKSSRRPRTMRELAELLGYKSEQVFYKWKQQDWFQKHNVETMRESIFVNYLGDVDRATIAAALNGSHQDRKLFYDELRRSIGSEDAGRQPQEVVTYTPEEWQAERERRRGQAEETLNDFE